MPNNSNNLPQQLEQFQDLPAETRQKRLVKLKQDRDWSEACVQLTKCKGWSALVDRLELVKKEAGEQLVTLAVPVDMMETIATKVKSRLDFIQEIEQSAKLFEQREETLSAFLKIQNRH